MDSFGYKFMMYLQFITQFAPGIEFQFLLVRCSSLFAYIFEALCNKRKECYDENVASIQIGCSSGDYTFNYFIKVFASLFCPFKSFDQYWASQGLVWIRNYVTNQTVTALY